MAGLRAGRWLVLASLVIAAALPAGLAGAVPDIAADLLNAYKSKRPMPLASQAMGNLDEAAAYALQNQYLARLTDAGETPSGLKAGLTSPPAQERFKAPGPVMGVLMKSMLISNGVIELKNYANLMLEVEIGFILGRDITTRVDAESVKAYVQAVAPAIEAPDVAFTDMKALTYADLIAANVSPRGYLIGQPVAHQGLDLNALTGQLLLDGQPVGPPVPGKAALGDQWQALAWTLNKALAQGQKITKGMAVITGSLGPMYLGKPGQYKAVYTGGLGELEFSVR